MVTIDRSAGPGVVGDLIFDVGMFDGADTDYYLRKGFRVVGFEPNPELIDRLRHRFRRALGDGRLIVEPCGLSDRSGPATFYVNRTEPQWSSFRAANGCRGSAGVAEYTVTCLTLDEVIARHGCPHYLKLDSEGSDTAILRGLEKWRVRPDFVSVGEASHEMSATLVALGFNRFRIVPQNDKSAMKAPYPPREGVHVPMELSSRHTGLFGRDLRGWITIECARSKISEILAGRGIPGEWYDLHATRWPISLDPAENSALDVA